MVKEALGRLERGPGSVEAPSGDVAAPVFPELLWPFVEEFADRLGIEVRPSVLADLQAHLLRRLSGLAARTVAHELKRRGMPYPVFLREHLGSRGGAQDLLCRYPVLARHLGTCTLQLVEVTGEVLRRLDRDRPAIQRLLTTGSPPGELVRVHPGLSDHHRGGRTVWRLDFDSGLRLIYKPRSLAIDVAFQDLVAQLNRRGLEPPLWMPVLLPRPEYGWCEFVEERPCADRAGVARYFRRQGVLAALFHLLCATDFHCENIIPQGEHPVPVDLEALLSPGLHVPDPELADLDPALRPLLHTVVATLMTPYWRSWDADRPPFFSSGIGGNSGERAHRRQSRWVGIGTRQMHLEQTYQPAAYDRNLPRLDDRAVPLEGHLPEVLEGFAAAYRLLLEHRDELLASDGPLAAFRATEVRTLVRSTLEYAQVLFWATAPDLLESGAAHDVALEVLCSQPLDLPGGRSIAGLYEDEKAALWRHDIPVYHGRPDTRDVVSGEGWMAPEVLDRPTLQQVEIRLRQIGERDLAWQLEVIRASFDMTFVAEARPAPAPGSSPLLGMARQLGETLAALRLHTEHGCAWLDLIRGSRATEVVTLLCPTPWTPAGGAGTAIFFVELAAHTGDAEVAAIARDALTHAALLTRDVLARPGGEELLTAGLSGVGLVLHALAAGSQRLQEPRLLEAALELVAGAPRDAWKIGASPDVLGGAAGSLLALHHLYALRGDPAILDRAEHLARGLVAAAVHSAEGLGWITPIAPHPLVGLAHGASGVALALARHQSATGDPSLRDIVRGALDLERHHHDATVGDWPSLQGAAGSPRFMTGWCAGAPGIGLARLELVRLLGDPSIHDDLERALIATRRHLGQPPHNLCCGEAGRLIFLARAGQQLGRPELTEAATAAALALVESFTEHGTWHLQEFPEGLLMPGLLGGAAGIGLALLTVANPEEAACPLVLC